MLKCERCEKQHDGSYGSGRFCNKECAKGFSRKTFNLTEESKQKISSSLKERWKNNEFEHVNWVMSGAKGSSGKYKKPDSLFSVSSRTMAKILVRMITNENLGCSLCGWKDDIGDMHHINGRKIENPDNHKNLTYICPTCHRLVHKHKIEKSSLISLDEQIGDSWKKYYYG